ncbi:hypothetical protein HAZT_HAZT009473 [Hyalella azteca]|uniref:Amidase domain-containing protein n=1 Tax=Hyalella azteca TaxID=294128 RepID=A0A6A0H362_HYAAZ|nr:hypothetical protein HAZT_HAZT009473 [Hyalella azteca]
MDALLSAVLTLVWPVLRVLRRAYDSIVHLAFAAFFSFRKTTPLPPVFNPNLLLSATQLARAIREGKVGEEGERKEGETVVEKNVGETVGERKVGGTVVEKNVGERKVGGTVVENNVGETVGERKVGRTVGKIKVGSTVGTVKRTSVSIVRAYISRTSDVNPLLNALAQEDFQEALQEARRVDERIAQGFKNGTLTVEELERTQPFLGVPFTVKESIAAAGLYHTGGLISRRYTVAQRDAEVVERVRKAGELRAHAPLWRLNRNLIRPWLCAGGILLATTNVSELGNWWESENRLYGATNNPYNLNRTPGGSSGGEAALMCACGTPLSIGSDIGGSLRTPALFCGLFSHKPTAGKMAWSCSLISARGVGISEPPSPNTVLTAGPITRHSEDLIPMLKEAVVTHFLATHDISVTKVSCEP